MPTGWKASWLHGNGGAYSIFPSLPTTAKDLPAPQHHNSFNPSVSTRAKQRNIALNSNASHKYNPYSPESLEPTCSVFRCSPIYCRNQSIKTGQFLTPMQLPGLQRGTNHWSSWHLIAALRFLGLRRGRARSLLVTLELLLTNLQANAFVQIPGDHV
eukprot:666889-Pelagomonas_calceolata.AAC.3